MILTAEGAAAAKDLPWGRVYSIALPPARASTWAWLSDTHIAASSSAERDGRRPVAALRQTVDEITAVRPAGTLVNGDLAWSSGEPADYERFLAITRPLVASGPLALGLGNHDHRGNMLAAASEGRGLEPRRVAAVIDRPPFRFVMLDSLAGSGQTGGEIGGGQLRWLDGLLAREPGLRTLLLVHHPGESASAGALDFDALEDLARSRDCVQAIVTGHEHEFTIRESGSGHLIGLPAVGFPFDRGTPCGWVEARLSEECISLRLHAGRHSSLRALGWRRAGPAAPP